MTKISRRKGISPRFKVLKEVDYYQNLMGTLISCSKADNEQEETKLKDVLSIACELLFKSTKEQLMRKDPGGNADWNTSIQFNDSVSCLRTSHNRFVNAIKKKEFYSPGVY